MSRSQTIIQLVALGNCPLVLLTVQSVGLGVRCRTSRIINSRQFTRIIRSDAFVILVIIRINFCIIILLIGVFTIIFIFFSEIKSVGTTGNF